MRLAFVIAALSCGGAERVFTRLANHFARQGHAVTVLAQTPPEADHYPLAPAIERARFGDGGGVLPHSGLLRNVRRVRSLRAALRAARPDAVVSFLSATNVLALLATRRPRIPVVVSERVDPPQVPLGRAWEFLRDRTYPWADALVVQSEAIRPWAHRRLLPERVHVIANPVLPPEPAAPGTPGTSGTSGPYIAAMGRLVPQKGFDMLLAAFARLAATHPEWRIAIIGGPRGDGAEAEELHRLAEELRIADRVTWCGQVANPAPLLAGASIFALPSRFEGFPNALTEAMACGTPVVAFDCPTGPADIVRHEVDGLLLPLGDVDGLTGALGRLMDDEGLRNAMGDRAREVCERFAPERIFAAWERLLAGLPHGKD
ncbi:MAG: glycosyltransferase family 4 protein [Desulfovibrionaceae bacterium]|jgi:glycosyltransferase involved in cell wall biosynthesis|nr:glycosyltransferase family 4 protein [Desulfovibrionaceae bacterium]